MTRVSGTCGAVDEYLLIVSFRIEAVLKVRIWRPLEGVAGRSLLAQRLVSTVSLFYAKLSEDIKIRFKPEPWGIW